MDTILPFDLCQTIVEEQEKQKERFSFSLPNEDAAKRHNKATSEKFKTSG